MRSAARGILLTSTLSLVSLGAAFSWCQDKPDVGSAVRTERPAFAIAGAFLRDIGSYLGSAARLEEASLSEGRSYVSGTSGLTVELGGPDYVAVVSESQHAVKYFLNRRGFPESHPAIDANGQVVSPLELEKKSVRVSLADAERVATAVRDRAVGAGVSGHLCRVDGELVSRGSYFVYDFSWFECVDEHAYANIMARVFVQLNPETGAVISVTNQASAPSEQPDDAVRTRLDAAIRSAIGDEPCTAVRKVPYRFWHKDGTSEDRCTVRYECADSPRVGTLVFSLPDVLLVESNADASTAGVWDTNLVGL